MRALHRWLELLGSCLLPTQLLLTQVACTINISMLDTESGREATSSQTM